MSKELKPCRCGEERIVEHEGYRYFTTCLECDYDSELYDTMADAITAWNTRPEIAPKDQRVNIQEVVEDIDTSQDRLLKGIPADIEEVFGDWYRKNNISVNNYWLLIQVLRFIKENDSNIDDLKNLINDFSVGSEPAPKQIDEVVKFTIPDTEGMVLGYLKSLNNQVEATAKPIEIAISVCKPEEGSGKP